MRLVVLVLLLGTPASAKAPAAPYASAGRVAYLNRALEAITQVEPQTLEHAYAYINAMKRNACTSAFERLRVECLIQAAKRSCRGRTKVARRACLVYSDVIVVNLLGEEKLISTGERYRIMNENRLYRRELRRELRRRHGALTTDFRLSSHFVCEAGDLQCLPGAIDSFCREYAGTHDVSWQTCAGALVWFIGTAEHPPPE